MKTFRHVLDRTEWGILIFILVVSVILRLPGIAYGVPIFEAADDNYVLHESVKIASFERPAAQFGLPDATLFYSNALALRVVFEALKITNQTSAPNVTAAYEDFHEPWIHETARVVNLIWVVTGFILFTFFTRRFFGKKTALIALAFLSVSSIMLEYFIEIRPDVPSIALIFATLLTSANIAEKGRRKDYVLTGVMLGLSVATKYPLILLFIPIVLAHAKATQKNRRAFFVSRSFWMLVVFAFLTFFLLTPLLFFFPSRALLQIRYEGRSQHFGADGLSFGGNLWFYLTHVLNYGIGTLAAIVSLFGTLLMFKKHPRVALFIWSFPVATLTALSFHPLHWDRWMIPVLPFQALAAGFFIAQIMQSKRRILKVGATILFVLAFVPAGLRSLSVVSSWTYSETRGQARDWVVTNAPNNSRIMRSAYTPLINDPRFTENLISTIGAEKTEVYEGQNIDYFIVNNKELERFFANTVTPEQHKAYARKTLANGKIIFTAQVPENKLLHNVIRMNDWRVFQNASVLDARNGDPISIYAFSEKAKAGTPAQ